VNRQLPGKLASDFHFLSYVARLVNNEDHFQKALLNSNKVHESIHRDLFCTVDLVTNLSRKDVVHLYCISSSLNLLPNYDLYLTVRLPISISDEQNTEALFLLESNRETGPTMSSASKNPLSRDTRLDLTRVACRRQKKSSTKYQVSLSQHHRFS
jgi:hypothetical protein